IAHAGAPPRNEAGEAGAMRVRDGWAGVPYKQVQITERNATKKRCAPFNARSAFKLRDKAL
ncbi:uncharacterized protein SCHCODRAFT_02626458, partial [Schizophyllum commune H4-8]|uniref:uncharacterized protein n=1 Tax=Schizophyllum commune (strain H4-8 / FGSC 9210) TaxID=578458 RepID=UPI0021609E59